VAWILASHCVIYIFSEIFSTFTICNKEVLSVLFSPCHNACFFRYSSDRHIFEGRLLGGEVDPLDFHLQKTIKVRLHIDGYKWYYF